MIILEDSRQQELKHETKHEWFAENGIEIRRSKLYVGDYTLPTNQSICIDTKASIEELVSNICGQQHERFRGECKRASEAGIKLIILVENDREKISGTDIYNPLITKLDDLHKWKNPRLFIMKPSKEVIGYSKNGSPRYKRVQKYPNATRGITLQRACYTMQAKYGVEFQFVATKDCGQRIVDILGGNTCG